MLIGMSMISSSSSSVVYDGAVVRADLDLWETELEDVLARIRSLYYRPEPKRHAEQYIRGLLSELERKNGWTIAERSGELEPKALQRFLNLSPWDADALRDRNREYAMDNFADPGGILVADPTGVAKKGIKSVGVQRQYSGTLGPYCRCRGCCTSELILLAGVLLRRSTPYLGYGPELATVLDQAWEVRRAVDYGTQGCAGCRAHPGRGCRLGWGSAAGGLGAAGRSA